MTAKFDQNRLSAVSLDISDIHVRCQIWRSPRNHRKGGYVAFEGTYLHGSAGSDDARFIRWTLRQFLEVARVDGLVIDCTALIYEWGDDLSFSAASELPFLVAINPDHSEAYLHAVNVRHHRASANAALAEMDDQIRTMKSLL